MNITFPACATDCASSTYRPPVSPLFDGGGGGGVMLDASAKLYSSGTVTLIGTNGIIVRSNPANSIIIDGSAATAAGIAGIQGSGVSVVTNGTVHFSNLNGVTFGLSGSTITASIPLAITQVSLIGNTAGTATIAGPGIQIAGGNNITVSGAGGDTFTISARNQFPTAVYGDGGNSITSGAVSFVNSNGMTIGVAGNNVSFNWPGPRGVAGSGASTLTNGTLQFGNANNVTFGLNGSTMTASIPSIPAAILLSQFPIEPYGTLSSTAVAYTGSSDSAAGSTQFTGSGWLYSMAVPSDIAIKKIHMPLLVQASSAGTGSATVGICLGIYTLNANTRLDLLSSFHAGILVSQNSTTAVTAQWWWGSDSAANSTGLTGNSTSRLSGSRVILMNDSEITLRAGNYFFGQMITQRTSSANVYGITSLYIHNLSNTQLFQILGQASTTRYEIGGVFSLTTNTNVIPGGMYMPATFDTTLFLSTGGTSQWLKPFFFMNRSNTT